MGDILVGTSSWSERTLVHESGWYPRRTMKAAERIAYYAERFPLVEIDATSRFPPTPELARQWVERTPPGFTIDIDAWTLFTGAATLPDSLWEDLRTEVRPELRDRRRLYAGHLSRAGMKEAWARFRHAIEPLRESGRLGVVILRYPHWLKPGDTGRGLLLQARRGLGDLELVVELANPGWLDGSNCEATLSFLENHGLGLVCTDSAGDPPVVAATSDVAVVRFAGRRGDEVEWPGCYRYSPEELEAWVPKLRDLAGGDGWVHVLFANTYRDWAVSNAEELSALLAGCRA
ncbi:MAG: DUF72 domain-containing protein [Actinomycetota bacterium]|nr:DUF72 domain-containing protein [Actinomycetota bacterium]